MARIQRPLRDLAAWLAYFRAAPIPVLDATAIAVRELAVNEDAVDAHSLAETVSGDPLMTLKLLAHVGSNSRRETDVETVVGALVLLGIGPFFRHFGELPTIGQALGDTTDASAATSANGGNCYNCHQISKAEISYGTIGPSLYNYGKLRGVADPASPASKAIVEYTWGKLYNAKAYNACSGMPRFGHGKMLDEAQLKHLMALLLDPKSPVNQ